MKALLVYLLVGMAAAFGIIATWTSHIGISGQWAATGLIIAVFAYLLALLFFI